MCHFIDLARHLVGQRIESVDAQAAAVAGGSGDDVAAHIRFVDGSLASIVYTALGDTALAKERIEMFAGGRAAVLDDFRTLTLVADGKSSERSATQNKGHAAQLAAFVAAVRVGGAPPIDEAELIETSAATIAVVESLRTGTRISV